MTFYKQEAETIFDVISVESEPHAESTWSLKFNDIGPFILYDLMDTSIKDELLAGKTIQACVYLPCNVVNEEICSKSIELDGVTISKVTGQLKTEFYEDGAYSYQLDSIFPIIIDLGKKLDNFTPGQWLTVMTDAEYWIILPRGKNLK